MIKADYPNRFTELDQVNSYLHQLAEKINLNFANTTAEAIWRDTEKALSVLGDKEASAKEKADILASYSAMRSLIIKTAEYTVENSEKIKLSMAGEYVAKSEFGDYFEKATVDIEGTPVGITQLYGYTSGITGEFGDITVDSHNFIKTGLLYYDENSLPVYGVGVGELATKVDANGHTVLDRSNLLATYAADEIAFWQDSEKVAYINNGALYMPAANITGGTLNINNKFTVDLLGNMKAENADITGKVKCTVLDCTNATVTGLVVGENITMGEGAVISWNNVNNKPDNLATTDDIPTSTSELTNDSGFAYTSDIPDTSNFIRKYGTYITDTAIWSGSLTANNLTITGGAINITTGAEDTSVISLSYGGKNATLSPSRLMLTNSEYQQTYMTGTDIRVRNGNLMTVIGGGAISINGYNVATLNDLASYATTSAVANLYGYGDSPYFSSTRIIPGKASVDTCYVSTTTSSGGFRLLGTSDSLRAIKNSVTEDLSKDENLNPEHLYDLPVVLFKYNEGYYGDEVEYDYSQYEIGFIAEDMDEFYPKAAVYRDGKLASWTDRNLIPPMLKLIQNHKKEIDALKERIDTLEN